MKRKILIVEDDLDIVDLLQSQVKALGYDSIVAGNGKEAVDMATSQLPHLILMDIMLPVMDGLDATRQIRQNPTTRSIPIIAVTALSSRRDKEKCLQSGCDDYLSKPFTQFTRLQLGSRIEKLLKSSEKQQTA
ncbi:MAG: response regulator [Deltaproteobacteria bacterium]|nr:response regulator [Deltaproteobacteria bacterium]